MTRVPTFALLCGLSLAGCGSNQQPSATPSPEPAVVRTCDSIRPQVIRTAATNGVTIVKIYDPKTVRSEPKKVSCSGRALVSTGQEGTIYYRDFQDTDGDWLVQYAEKPLD